MTSPEIDILAAKVSLDHDLLVRMDQKLDTVIEKIGDHETRIRGMEKKQYALAGAAAVAGWLIQHIPFYARIG